MSDHDYLSQAIAHGITKTGVAVEMMDLRSADHQEVRELVGIASGLVIATPPTTGDATTTAQTAIATILAATNAKQSFMANNTTQFRWIVVIQQNLDWLFADDPNVFVAGDLFWYPVQGKPNIVNAPDVMVVLGRAKGERGSYQQWKEENIAPQVVFEILYCLYKLKAQTRCNILLLATLSASTEKY